LNKLPFILYVIGFVVISFIRGYYTQKYRNLAKEFIEKNLADRIFLAMAGISMILPFIYKLTDFLDFADYELPVYFSLAGFFLFIFASWLLYKSHKDLGNAWSPRPGINKNHSLVKSGIYSRIRHPMYASHILWGIAQILLIHNWIAGFSLYISILLLYLNRVNREERILYKKFGKDYLDYMENTGRIMPLIKGPK
jgi:protein-S-isoprenylcysteine O-methyltransferase Ste14